jgi:hypothetical protein
VGLVELLIIEGFRAQTPWRDRYALLGVVL